MTLMIARGARRPVTGGWVTVFSQTLNSNSYDSYGQYTFRQVIDSTLWAVSISTGTKIRVTLEATTGHGLAIDEMFFAQQKGGTGDDRYGYLTTADRITFNGGSNGFSIAASATILSDEIALINVPSFNAGNNYVFGIDLSNTVALGSPRSLVTLSGAAVYNKVASDAAATAPTGYTNDAAGNLAGIKKIEVFGFP